MFISFRTSFLISIKKLEAFACDFEVFSNCMFKGNLGLNIQKYRTIFYLFYLEYYMMKGLDLFLNNLQ